VNFTRFAYRVMRIEYRRIGGASHNIKNQNVNSKNTNQNSKSYSAA